MKAISVGTYGGPEVLKIVETPIPTPGEQDVVQHIASISVTFDAVLDLTGDTERELPLRTLVPLAARSGPQQTCYPA